MNINGGIVHRSIRFPRDTQLDSTFAVQGIWTGGEWSPEKTSVVQQYKRQRKVAEWQLVGIDILNRSVSEPVLILKPLGQYDSLQAGDILVFGDGAYTELQVEHSDLKSAHSVAVEVSAEKYRGIAEVNDVGSMQRIIVFHGPGATIPSQNTQQIWRNQLEYSVTLRLDELRQQDYSLELHMNHTPVVLNRLLKTLQPLRQFILDSGQELHSLAPSPGGRRLKSTYTAFEPTITAERGSLRVFLHPATPEQLPLYVSPAYPLQLIASVFQAAADRKIDQVIGLLFGDFFTPEILLQRLIEVAEVATRHGTLSVREEGTETIVDETVLETLRASLESVPLRQEERTGQITAIETTRSWLRLRCQHNDKEEEWTLLYTADHRDQLVDRVIPRLSFVQFETRSMQDSARGRGRLRSIRNL